ncbi:MAG: TonB-dependent receptor plug domain-containing protein, partial [Candidatus Dadabacteria bacterium]
MESEPPRSLEPVVVTGTLNPASLSQTPASVTVITREQIEERNPSSVAEILQQVPGLYVDQPASRGGVTSVYIRGGDPNFTLVL